MVRQAKTHCYSIGNNEEQKGFILFCDSDTFFAWLTDILQKDLLAFIMSYMV